MSRSMRRAELGFSLLEVVAASTILTFVLLGINSVLVGYSKTRNTAISGVVGRNIAAGILDDIQMRLLVENSLTSDPSGARARSVFLPAQNITVSNFFFWCFPDFPAGSTHNTQGSIWNNLNVPVSNAVNVSIVRTSPGRLFGAGGTELVGKTKDFPEVAFIARISVLGSNAPDLNLGRTGGASSLREFINGRKVVGTTTYTTGEFLDTDFDKTTRNTDDWCWILDSDTKYEVENFGNGATSRLNQIVTKVVVVRVYDRDVYVQQTPVNSFKGKPRVAESYVVFGGQVRI